MLIPSNREPSRSDLCWFARLFGPAFLVTLGVFATRHGALAWAVACWTAAASLFLVGLIAPVVTRPAYMALIRATLPIAWFMSNAILLTVFFGVITPIGWLLRWFRDPMERRFVRDAGSYWLPRQPPPMRRYFRQF